MDTVHEEALAAAGVRADGTIDINAALRALLEGLLNAVMDEQASELGVPRNGYRERSLDTCVGRVMNLPRFRLHPYAAIGWRSSSGQLARSNSSGLRYPSAECVLTLL